MCPPALEGPLVHWVLKGTWENLPGSDKVLANPVGANCSVLSPPVLCWNPLSLLRTVSTKSNHEVDEGGTTNCLGIAREARRQQKPILPTSSAKHRK